MTTNPDVDALYRYGMQEGGHGIVYTPNGLPVTRFWHHVPGGGPDEWCRAPECDRNGHVRASQSPPQAHSDLAESDVDRSALARRLVSPTQIDRRTRLPAPSAAVSRSATSRRDRQEWLAAKDIHPYGPEKTWPSRTRLARRLAQRLYRARRKARDLGAR